jgi:protein-S-isoprenylcysteine O-methyltransferase Ste14
LEEKKLIKKYGEVYISYKQRVPALIPWFRRSS